MKTLKDVKATNKKDSHLSLCKIAGKKIKDILVYPTTERGDVVLKLFQILFEDGSYLYIEGEHDCSYVDNYDPALGINDDELNAINDEWEKEICD